MRPDDRPTSGPDAPTLDRRAALGALGGGVVALVAGSAGAQSRREGEASTVEALRRMFGWDEKALEYVLPDLPYAYDALEPHIDEQTMRVHHGRHHAGYVRGLNRALGELAVIRSNERAAGMIQHWSRQLSFHGSGHVNHALFWRCMAPEGEGGGGAPGGALASAIDRDFGSYAAFRRQFVAASASVEGSGWGWLVWEPIARRLLVLQMENQQLMLMTGAVPLLGVDVWEHAYYLKYQNRRRDYVEAFMRVVNWPFIESLFDRASARA